MHLVFITLLPYLRLIMLMDTDYQFKMINFNSNVAVNGVLASWTLASD